MSENISKEWNILVVGKTGHGKSSLCGTLTRRTEVFKVSSSTVSETTNHTKLTVQEEGITLTVVDTIGLGDTESSLQKVLYRIADACWAVKDGFHQIFFVTSGRMTEEEIMCFNLLRTVIFDNKVCDYTTIVRTKFEGFMDVEECCLDAAKMRTNEQMDIIGKVKDHKTKDDILKAQIEDMHQDIKQSNETIELLRIKEADNVKELSTIRAENHQRSTEIQQLQAQVMQSIDAQIKAQERHGQELRELVVQKERREEEISRLLEDQRKHIKEIQLQAQQGPRGGSFSITIPFCQTQ
eukprot:gene12151-14218_t